MDKNQLTGLFEAISLSEAYILVILLILSCVLQNLYLLLVLGLLFTKHLPEQILKRLSNYFGWNIGNRPIGARNCNSLNAGGLANSSGLVSGHVFNMTSLTFFLLYKFTENDKKPNAREITLLCFMYAFIYALMTARVNLLCHTKEQVIIGFLLGIAWGYVMFVTANAIIKTSPRLQEDEKRINAFLNGC